MSRSLNEIKLIGNVGADPEIRTTQAGTKVATISVATSRKFRDRNGQDQEKTQWHRVTLWDRRDGGGLASLAEKYLNKGDRVYISGEMEYGSYDKEVKGETIKMYTAEVTAREMIMLGGNNGGGNNGGNGGQRRQNAPAPAAAAPAGGNFSDDDDLPF